MSKTRWTTFSIRLSRWKAAGLQTVVPLTVKEWNALQQWLQDHKHQLVEEDEADDGLE